MSAQDIQFWQIRRRSNRRKPWEVRWRVDASQFSRSFLTKALGETFRANLFKAAKAGEVFSLATGEPESWARSAETLYLHARAFVAVRWNDGGAANTRKALVSHLIPAVLAFVDPRKAAHGRPDDALLRRALRECALRPPSWEGTPPDDVARALEWIARVSRPVQDLADPAAVRALLDALTTGAATSHATVHGRRWALRICAGFAVERRLLPSNPLDAVQTRRQRKSRRVDHRRVPSLEQAHRLLIGVRDSAGVLGGHLHAWFAVMYYAGCRPGEVRGLRAADCVLPSRGWGSLTLAGSAPEVGGDWTDDGDQYESRELKHRAPGETRVVPVPPLLVKVLQEHLAAYGTAPDGRLFWNVETDGYEPVSGTLYRRAWEQGRKAALSGPELVSELAKRPYDLRHGNASFLLSLGVAPTEAARRLGHGVGVLLTTYAHWLEGQEQHANIKIEKALSRGLSAGQPRAKAARKEINSPKVQVEAIEADSTR